MDGQDRLRELLAATRLAVDATDFVLVGLPRDEAGRLAQEVAWLGGGFVSLTVDGHEVSAVLRAQEWAALASRFPQARSAGPYRLLTFDLVLDFDVVGYLAAVTAALAARGVSVYALSAYSRDHILVRREDVPAALEALAALIGRSR